MTVIFKPSWSGLQKRSKKIRCFLFPLMNFRNWFIVFYFRWFFQRIQRNEFNESTNKIFVDFTKFQRIFNENFNESAKISTDQRKFSKSLRIRWNFVRNWPMLWKLWLISWKFGWLIGIFVENSSKFLQINENFIRWFVEFVDEFSNQYLFVDFVFQINEFNEINIFFNENESTKKYFQQKNIFLEPWSQPNWESF